jgi:hypothetical protein
MPCHPVIRELRRSWQIKRKPFYIIATGNHPQRFGHSGDNIIATMRYQKAALLRLSQDGQSVTKLSDALSANIDRSAAIQQIA